MVASAIQIILIRNISFSSICMQPRYLYFALYQTYKLIGYIDKNKAFSKLSVRVLKNIKYCAAIISSLFVVGLPLFYLIAEKDDAPGIILIGMALIFASMVIAVLLLFFKSFYKRQLI